jgi:molybdopterin-biosynthesis enzyme MoeA-like protein
LWVRFPPNAPFIKLANLKTGLTNQLNMTQEHSNNKITASFLIIGNEILSGRTDDKNLNHLAKELTLMGIDLCEVRVVADLEQEIIDATNQLRKKYNYLFTSGGIGPTHDDITTESITKAFNDNLIENQEAKNLLIDYYGIENLNLARLKMAKIPSRALLINNKISGAPGFYIENVFVMAGIPRIFQSMLEAAKPYLKQGKRIESIEIKIRLTESIIAKPLTDLQEKYRDISMGSYPFEGGTSLVFRSSNIETLRQVVSEMKIILTALTSETIE